MHTLPHLTPERLAALADEPPTPPEQAHLDGCPPCRRERDSHAAILAMASDERSRIGPPVSSWEAVAAGLRAGEAHVDGSASAPLTLVPASGVSESRQSGATHVTFSVPHWAMQAAAALLLVVGGVAGGRLTARSGSSDGITATLPRVTATHASNPARFRSREEALLALQAAEHEYQRATEYLAGIDSVSAPAPEASAAEVYRARLAAFDGVVAATQQALYAAPADPVINRYYLATSAAREVALKQLSLVAPAGGQINRY